MNEFVLSERSRKSIEHARANPRTSREIDLENELGRLKKKHEGERKGLIGLIIVVAWVLGVAAYERGRHIDFLEEKYRVKWEDTWEAQQPEPVEN